MLISNPANNPLFPTTTLVLGLLLLGSLLALVLVVRGNVAALPQNVLFQRWRVWAIIAV